MSPKDPPSDSCDESRLKSNIEFAWRSHAAQENWTSKVDTKASIFFTINGAGFAALVALRTQRGSFLEQLTGCREIFSIVSIILCGFAVVIAGIAIFPLLGRVSDHRGRTDLIYFGHLRHREVGDLAKQLASVNEHEQLEQLSRQLIVMAKGNWTKHRTLQVALVVALVGYMLMFSVVMI